MSVTDTTVEAMTESLNYWDELVIAKVFKADLNDLPGTGTLRALVLIDRKRRLDEDDKTAGQVAKDMPMGALMSYFAENTEVTPDEPVTEEGKDD